MFGQTSTESNRIASTVRLRVSRPGLVFMYWQDGARVREQDAEFAKQRSNRGRGAPTKKKG